MSVQEVLDLAISQEMDYEIPCTSAYCTEILRKPSHLADWAIYLSCTCQGYYCNWRMDLYWAEDHEVGTMCGIHDDYHVRLVNWIRIRRSA